MSPSKYRPNPSRVAPPAHNVQPQASGIERPFDELRGVLPSDVKLDLAALLPAVQHLFFEVVVVLLGEEVDVDLAAANLLALPVVIRVVDVQVKQRVVDELL